MAEIVVAGSVRLSHYGAVTDLTWSTGWGNDRPGGCQEASWLMDLPGDRSFPPLQAGRTVEIYDGPARVWKGYLSEPVRDAPWQLHARGAASFAGDYLALDATGAPTTITTTAVTAAINRGFPVTGSSGIASGALAATAVKANRLGDLLDAAATKQADRWAVFADGVLVMAADPTTPKWYLHLADAASGVADDQYITHVYARYVSAVDANGNPTAYGIAVVSDDTAAARWGRSEHALDLTSLGLLSSAQAQAHASGVLAQNGARMGFTEPFEATPDNLTSLGGIPARLSLVKAGDMVRVFGVTDPAGMVELRGYRDIVIGETQYVDGSDVLTLKPVGMAPRTLVDVIAAPDTDGFTA